MRQPNFESEQMAAMAEVVRHSVQQSVEQAIAPLSQNFERLSDSQTRLDDALVRLAEQNIEIAKAIERLTVQQANLEKSVHDLRIDMKENFKAMEERWDKRTTAMEERWDKRTTAMDERWDRRTTAMDERWDRRIARLEEHMRGIIRHIYYAISIAALLLSAAVALAEYLPNIF